MSENGLGLNPEEERKWNATVAELADSTGPVTLYVDTIPFSANDLDLAILENKEHHGLTTEKVRRGLDITAKIHSLPEPRAVIAELHIVGFGLGYLVDLMLPEDENEGSNGEA